MGGKMLRFLTLCVAVALVSGDTCDKIAAQIKYGKFNAGAKIPCYLNPCKAEGEVGPEDECPAHCQKHGGGCYGKFIPMSELENMNGNDVSGRSFGGGGGGLYPFPQSGYPPILPPFPQPCPKKFPDNCGVNPHDPHLSKLLEPPVDVPYCQRTPCSMSNPRLENDRLACHSQPGCYFDVELATLRQAIGYGVLPGVPACHLAIRNAAFHRIVRNYVQESGKEWNGLYTNCLLDQHQQEIEEPNPGCYMVDVFQYVGIKPKRAGWRGITPKDCSLVGGCFKPGTGCFYPARLGHVRVPAGEDRHRAPHQSGRDIYGQPVCLPLNKNTPAGDFLDDYHNCRRAGCVVDPSVNQKTLNEQLLNITLTLVPQRLRQRYYDLILQGVVAADNWRFFLEKLQTEPQIPTYGFPGSHGGGSLNLLAYSLGLGANKRNSTAGRYHLQNGPVASAGLFPNSFPFQVPGFGKPVRSPFAPKQPSCPYRNYNIGSFRPLKGSFSGCCEHSLCYIPRSDLRYQFSGVASYLANWQKWSECSVTCGGGHRTRERRCVAYKHESCGSEAATQTEVCNSQKCPYPGPWGTWSSCDAACGGGTQRRVRYCFPEGSKCSGDLEESRSCQTGKCPELSGWSAYSSCSVSCGIGERRRARRCVSGGAYGCAAVTEKLEERVRCEIFCGKAVEVAATACEYPACRVTKSYRCEYQGKEGHCRDFKETVTSRCREGYCQYIW